MRLGRSVQLSFAVVFFGRADVFLGHAVARAVSLPIGAVDPSGGCGFERFVGDLISEDIFVRFMTGTP
jgi:hypothetical protein